VSYRPPKNQSRLPGLFVFVLGAVLIFGAYTIWQGATNFIRTGGMGVVEATQRAQIVNSATAVRVTRLATQASVIRPSATPLPECLDFRVIVPSAIVRELPASNGTVITGLTEGTIVCVLSREPGTEWYAIDQNRDTRRPELAYMHESVIEAINPTTTPSITPTPSNTFTPFPTVTNTPIPVATDSPEPLPTQTRDTRTPLASSTPIPTITPTPITIQST